VNVEAGSAFAAGSPRILFEGRYVSTNTGMTYDVSADGERFLMIKNTRLDREAAPRQIVVVQNWFEELKRLAPSN
jgi:hypothetical protein